ncbi:MAG: hypothetical protein ACRD2Y_08030 [Terriglobales bacterium]
MNCVEFQNELSEILEGQRTAAHEAHLASCAACRMLLEDVNEIVMQARDLPLAEPGPQVWTRLRESLVQEGLVRESAPAPVAKLSWSWPRLSWADAMGYAAVAAVLVLAFGLVTYQQTYQPAADKTEPTASSTSGRIDDDDLQLLQEVQARRPDARGAYEASLREINTQIEEAERAVKEDPNDPQARQSLMEAHQQKSMVYEMALSRSVE